MFKYLGYLSETKQTYKGKITCTLRYAEPNFNISAYTYIILCEHDIYDI